MIKVSIENELRTNKQKKANELDSSDAIKEMKLLMSSEGAEDMRILRALGSDHQVIRDQETLGHKLQLEKLDVDYHGGIYTYVEIESLALKYNMRFLKSKYFKGKFDISAVAKLREFAKETNSSIDEYSIADKCYVLAPVSEFQLNEVVRPKKDPDPVLFYKVAEDHFRLVHKWGADFSLLRLISGFKHLSPVNYCIATFFQLLPFSVLLWTLILSSVFKYKQMGIFYLLVIVLPIIVSIIFTPGETDDNGRDKGNYSPGNWNNPDKITYR